MLAFTLVCFVACSSDDDTPDVAEETCSDGIMNNGETGVDCGGPNCSACEEETAEVTVTGEITEDTTWTNDTIYILAGKVVVGVDVTLTIQPGTIIKGSEGEGSLASALIVQRGAHINANGEGDPIIFTSVLDEITYDSPNDSNLDENETGLWGGVIILGNATASLGGGATEEQIEGIPASDTFGLYGGDDDTYGENITFKYVSIRHGGALIGEGNEINGLTLGGIGSEATISDIEIVANFDDGIEIFGGSVDVQNILVWKGEDDGIDLDQAYTGTISNAIVIQGPESDNALELDGPEGTLRGAYTITGLTLRSTTEAGDGNRRIANFKSDLSASINKVFVTGFPSTSKARLDDDRTATNYNNGDLNFSDWEIVLPEGVAGVNDVFEILPYDADEDEGVTITTTYGTDAENFATAITGEPTSGVGADTSVFSWTYTNAKGAL